MTENKKSQAYELIEHMKELEVFYSESEECYAKVLFNSSKEIVPIRSEKFKKYLVHVYITEINTKSVPKNNVLEEVIMSLEAKALFQSGWEPVHRRVAKTNDTIYIDLANSSREVIVVTKQGWFVSNQSPVNFIRSKSMLALPTPYSGGNLAMLKPFINYNTDDDFKLLLGWLLAAFRNDIPLPILIFQGEQGSAKSTTAKVLNKLVDPSEMPIRTLPNSERDLAISAYHSWLISFDNVSKINEDVSDSLCKIATGGALTTRTLFSDIDETIFKFKRPIMINGIGDIAERQDLLDRSIVIQLPSINQNQRKFEKDFWSDFEQKRPFIFGAILDALSYALGNESQTKLENVPRMSDFVKWVTAAEKQLGCYYQNYLEIYEKNKDEIVKDGIISEPFGAAVLDLVNDVGVWEGNVNQLLNALEKYVNKTVMKSSDWPSERVVRKLLSRLSPGLLRFGVIYTSYKNKSNRVLKLEKIEERHLY